jgi:hypothetical protein
MASQWYLVQGDDDLGPMTTDELKRLAADGKIGPRDLVRKEGTGRWVLASAVDGLLSAPVRRPSVPLAPARSPSTGSGCLVESPTPSDLDRATPPSAPEPQPAATAAPEGHRSPWRWVVAASALLTLVLAVARIATWIAMQDGSQVQEFAIPQPSGPPTARAVPRPARAGPVAKKAAPAAAVKRSPAPVDAPAPKVATPPSSPPSVDYIRLAKLLSNIHRGDEHDSWVLETNPRAPMIGKQLVPRNSGPAWVVGIDAGQSNLTHPGLMKVFGSYVGRPTPVNGAPASEQLTGAIPKLQGARAPVVKEAVARLEAGHQEAMDAARRIDEEVEAARRFSYDRNPPPGSPDSYERASERAEAAYERAKASAPERKRIALNGAMETARLDCWKTIAAKLPEVYREGPQSNDLIQFRITAPDAASKRRGEFAVANKSGQTLTNVTLVLDLLHFSTAPESSVFQVYFIPEWQAGHELRLAMTVEQNRECEAMKSRPINADPLHDFVGAGSSRSAADEWLAGLGGLVAVRASVWSAQANQSVRSFPFPDQALVGARWELGVAIRLARNLMPNMIRRAPRNTKFTLPADFWEVRAAQRVLTFVPPDSELARLAKLLIDDPVQLLRENRTARPATAGSSAGAGGPGTGSPGIDALIALLVPGTVFQGTWNFRMPNGPPMRNGPLTKERRKKLVGLTSRTSAFTLQINTLDPKTLVVTATLRAATPSGARRDFKGKIVEDQTTGRAILYFPVVKAADQRRQWLLDTDFDLFTAPETLTMERVGDGLAGKMPGPVCPDIYWFELKCTSASNNR